MYIPSLDPEVVREEAVRVLNPIGFPQPVSDITADTIISFGYPAAEIAARTGFAQLSPLKEGESEHIIATSAMTASLEDFPYYHPATATLTGDTRFGSEVFLKDAAATIADTATDVIVSTPTVTNSRVLYLTKSPRREVLLTVALPYRPDEVPDLQLRFYVRPLDKPLLSGETDLIALPTVSPTVAMETRSGFLAHIPGALKTRRALRASFRAASAFGEPATAPTLYPDNERLSARLSRVIHLGSSIVQSLNLWGRLSDGDTTTTATTANPGVQQIDMSALSGTDLSATLRSRPIYVTRCATVADARTVTSTTAPPDDPTSPTVTASIRGEGVVVINLTALLQPDRLVYTFRISTSDEYGFAMLDRDPAYPDREPCVTYGSDRRNARQAIRGAYLGSLLSVRQDTVVPYPVPYFSASEARRLAQEWNATSQYAINPSDRYRLEFDSASQRFRKILPDPDDGELNEIGTIDPVRIGDTLLYPVGAYDFLWTFDRTDAISKLSNKLIAAANVEANLDLLVGFDTDIEGSFSSPALDPVIGLANAVADITATLTAQQQADSTAAASTALDATLRKGTLEADASTEVSATLKTGQVDERASSDLDATLSDGEE